MFSSFLLIPPCWLPVWRKTLCRGRSSSGPLCVSSSGWRRQERTAGKPPPSSVCLSAHLSVCLSVFLSTHLSVYVSVCSANLSVCLLICLPVCVPLCVCVHVCVCVCRCLPVCVCGCVHFLLHLTEAHSLPQVLYGTGLLGLYDQWPNMGHWELVNLWKLIHHRAEKQAGSRAAIFSS